MNASPPQLTVKINRTFIDYLHNYPLILEAFGHYHHHPLHKASTEFEGGSISPARMAAIRSASPLPPSKFATSPVRSAKTVVFDATGYILYRLFILLHQLQTPLRTLLKQGHLRKKGHTFCPQKQN